MQEKTKSVLLCVTILLQSCGTMFDISGKGAKEKCLTLYTNTKTIDCTCQDKEIESVKIYYKQNSKDNFDNTKASKRFLLNPTVRTFDLPIDKDSSDKIFLEIEIHLTKTYWRESFYFKTKPGDFSRPQKIYSRYFGH